jgi:glycosyltransferase involved in cell wall biosynthesis
MSGKMRSVAVLEQRLTHYRCGFYERARELCFSRGIELHLVHGQPSADESRKNDAGALAWADVVANRFVRVGGAELVWQPFPAVGVPDLIILNQENRILSNYPWLVRRAFREVKVAYFGHGRNFQSHEPNGLRERWKSWLLNKVDWWFAYTEITVDIVLASGYPPARITLLDNAADTDVFRRDLDSVTPAQLDNVRAAINADAEATIGLFCGSLYSAKRLDYLVAAADQIQQRIPGFHLVVMGDGPSADQIRMLALSRPWLHWTGVQTGPSKAAYFKLASVILNPGLVGLHVLDSFCAGVPMVTTSEAMHSPEIAYLRDGVNGLVVSGTPEKYAAAVAQLLADSGRLKRLRQAALKDATRYTLDNMVTRFVEGVEQCLILPKKK